MKGCFYFEWRFKMDEKKSICKEGDLQKGIASSVRIGFWHAGEEEKEDVVVWHISLAWSQRFSQSLCSPADLRGQQWRTQHNSRKRNIVCSALFFCHCQQEGDDDSCCRSSETCAERSAKCRIKSKLSGRQDLTKDQHPTPERRSSYIERVTI